MPFDANDPDTKAAIKEAVEAAVAEAKEGLEAKNKDLLGKLKKAKEGASIDPSELAALEAANEKLTTDLAAANKAAKDAAKLAEKATKDFESEQGATRKLLVDNGLRELLVTNGVTSPVQQKAAMAILREVGPQVAIEGDNRVVKFGDKAAADFVKEWAGSEEGKHFVAAPNNGGGGAPGGKGSGEGGKVVSQEAFDAMNPKARSEHMTSGGTIAQEA